MVPSVDLPKIVITVCLRAAGLRRNIGIPSRSCNHVPDAVQRETEWSGAR
jgi:hypothetical protein